MAERVLANYEDMNGRLWAYLIPSYMLVSSGVQAGWNPVLPGITGPPDGLQRRYLNLRSLADGTRRRLYVADVTSTLWTGAVTTVTLPHSNGTTATYEVRGRQAESWRAPRNRFRNP